MNVAINIGELQDLGKQKIQILVLPGLLNIKHLG